MKRFESFDTRELSIKAWFIKEMYDVLTSKGEIYLLKIENASINSSESFAYRNEEDMSKSYNLYFSWSYARNSSY